MGARVVVTRPAREAERWLGALRASRVEALALPLIVIEPLVNTDALHRARLRSRESTAVMFVSAAAVEHFFGIASQVSASAPAPAPAAELSSAERSPRFWATGPGTVAALRHSGVPDDSIDAPPSDSPRFDSEALWQVVQGQVHSGAQILIVRGGNEEGEPTGRDWLQRRIVATGAACQLLVAYRRLAPVLDDGQRRLAGEAADGSAIWLFSSSEAIANLCRAMPETGWDRARAIATHPRIAHVAEAAGFGRVRTVAPGLDALVASIESFE